VIGAICDLAPVRKRPAIARIGATAAAAACGLLLAASGCGSAGDSSTATETVSTTAGGSSSHSTLRVNKTPRFAVPSPSSPLLAGVVQIAYRNIAIAPDAIRVKLGATIKWTNYDSIDHNVTSKGGPQPFASGDFGEGGTFEIRANKPGTIHYECTIHPTTMNGTIEVVG
jgi:plastocyanin